MRYRRHIFHACVICAVLMSAIPSCSNPDSIPATRSAEPYFSLAEYFNSEAVRLQEANPEIDKTVSKNGQQESKRINVADWQKELALFIDADINKPAWQHSYRIDSTATSVTYTSTDPKLRTTAIHVEKSEDGAITHIRVVNQVANMLYQTDEQLDYYADSLYRIAKQQHVRIIGDSNYTITGEWP